VATLKDLVSNIIDLFQEVTYRVSFDLNESGRDKAELRKTIELIGSRVLSQNFQLLSDLIGGYNPIVALNKIASVNDTGIPGGYTLANGFDEGQYV
jgi:hypothetical protein